MTVLTRPYGWFKRSFSTRGGRIEWLGALLALPFAYAALTLAVQIVNAEQPISIRTAHLASGSFFAAGMALGIYATAWSFAAEETHQRLAACSGIVDALACLSLAVVIERFFYAVPMGGGLLVLFALPVGLWLIATGLLIPAAIAKKRANPEGEVPNHGDTEIIEEQ